MCVLCQYELRLVASDNLNENYTDVVIHVRDVNDNPPQFDKPIYEAQITEEDDRGLPKHILQVSTEETEGYHEIDARILTIYISCIVYSSSYCSNRALITVLRLTADLITPWSL